MAKINQLYIIQGFTTALTHVQICYLLSVDFHNSADFNLFIFYLRRLFIEIFIFILYKYYFAQFTRSRDQSNRKWELRIIIFTILFTRIIIIHLIWNFDLNIFRMTFWIFCNLNAICASYFQIASIELYATHRDANNSNNRKITHDTTIVHSLSWFHIHTKNIRYECIL